MHLVRLSQWNDKFLFLLERAMSQTVKNILIAIAAGIVAGLILGGLLPMLGIVLSGSTNTIGVGITIAVTYISLNNRK